MTLVRRVSYKLSFELNELPPSLNVFMRMHFRERAKVFKRIENQCHLLMAGKTPEKPLAKFLITFTRFTIRPLDIDNLVASFKPVLDSIVRAGVIEDDKWTGTDSFHYKRERVSEKKDQRILMEIKSL